MAFFDEALAALDEAIAWLNDPACSEDQRREADWCADQVLEVAEQMGGGILGDIDNRLINKAKLIKEKLASFK